jgi:dihydropyrimidinase
MSGFDLVIRGGRVVLPDATRETDIGIRDGVIAAIGPTLPKVAREISAEGRLVLPGGVDSHCHMDQQPWKARRPPMISTVGRARRCAAAPRPSFPSPCRCAANRCAKSSRTTMPGRGESAYRLRLSPDRRRSYAQVLREELPALIKQGCTSIKIYLTYEGLKLDDYEFLSVLEVARSEGAMVMVHAENDACIRWLTDRFIAARKTQLRYHVHSHPEIGDREATFRAISFSELIETPILISHVAAAGAVEEIRRAKARGLPIYAETCPQYLFLSAEDIDTHDLSGATCVCTPPPRDKSNQPAIWQGILDGTLEVFSSDHSPWNYADKIAGGPDTPFNRVPNGVPGIETRLPLLFSAAVNGGRISLQKFAELTAGAPARLFGLAPRKGAIALGADADLAIWDSDRVVTIRNALLHHATDHTLTKDRPCRGWPVMTIARGEVVWDDGQLLSRPGRGQFIARQRPFPAASRACQECLLYESSDIGPTLWNRDADHRSGQRHRRGHRASSGVRGRQRGLCRPGRERRP